MSSQVEASDGGTTQLELHAPVVRLALHASGTAGLGVVGAAPLGLQAVQEVVEAGGVVQRSGLDREPATLFCSEFAAASFAEIAGHRGGGHYLGRGSYTRVPVGQT
ncbi:MAG TPA: hypothetical protein VFR38_17045 [Gaiellaceae bacterium]|nr:hypothetical protein [Gaiellaceae bacterium]